MNPIRVTNAVVLALPVNSWIVGDPEVIARLSLLRITLRIAPQPGTKWDEPQLVQKLLHPPSCCDADGMP